MMKSLTKVSTVLALTSLILTVDIIAGDEIELAPDLPFMNATIIQDHGKMVECLKDSPKSSLCSSGMVIEVTTSLPMVWLILNSPATEKVLPQYRLVAAYDHAAFKRRDDMASLLAVRIPYMQVLCRGRATIKFNYFSAQKMLSDWVERFYAEEEQDEAKAAACYLSVNEKYRDISYINETTDAVALVSSYFPGSIEPWLRAFINEQQTVQLAPGLEESQNYFLPTRLKRAFECTIQKSFEDKRKKETPELMRNFLKLWHPCGPEDIDQLPLVCALEETQTAKDAANEVKKILLAQVNALGLDSEGFEDEIKQIVTEIEHNYNNLKKAANAFLSFKGKQNTPVKLGNLDIGN